MTWAVVVAFIGIGATTTVAAIALRLTLLSRAESGPHKLADRIVKRFGWHVLIAIPTLAFLVAGIVAGFISIDGNGGDNELAQVVADATDDAPTEAFKSTTAPVGFEFIDGFHGLAIDDKDWDVENIDLSLIRIEDEALRLGLESSSDEFEWSQILARTEGARIDEVEFDIELVGFVDNRTPGAAGVDLLFNSGRNDAVHIGPGPKGDGFGLVIALYPEGVEPKTKRWSAARSGIEYHIRIVSVDGSVEFYISDAAGEHFWHREPVGDQYLTGVGIFANGDPGATYEVRLDNLRVLSR